MSYEKGLDEDRPDPQLDQGDRHPHEPQALEADGQPGAGLGGDVPEEVPPYLQGGGPAYVGHSRLDSRNINTPIASLSFTVTWCQKWDPCFGRQFLLTVTTTPHSLKS